jgi:hypothetical protein
LNPDVVTLRCSDCRKPLVGILVTDPKLDRLMELQAECCYGCVRPDGSPERSFVVAVRGRFQAGGHSVPDPDRPDEARVFTKLTACPQEGRVTLFKTVACPNG